jgi:hypothetical protein
MSMNLTIMITTIIMMAMIMAGKLTPRLTITLLLWVSRIISVMWPSTIRLAVPI